MWFNSNNHGGAATMPRMPNAKRALVPRQKLTDYLLSPSHPVGRTKAAFFRELGFSPAQWQTLADALRRHGESHPVSKAEATPFGTRFTVEGLLEAPGSRSVHVRSVWFIETADDLPRFVTAYPLPRRDER